MKMNRTAEPQRSNRTRIRHRGFTLIELMIVVTIIGILAAIAIPNFQRLIRRSKEASVRSNVHSVQMSIELFAVAHNGTYPLPADEPELRNLMPGGQYPPNPFTRAVTVILWNADPPNPGEIGIMNLPGGGYMLKARGQLAMLTPFIVAGD